MNCREAESLIQLYIDDKLPPKKLEAFISHVRKCPSCYEELETYFIIHYAVKYLDEDRQDSYNMTALLSENLNEKERHVRNHSRLQMAAVYVAILFGIILLGFLSMLVFPDEFVRSLFP